MPAPTFQAAGTAVAGTTASGVIAWPAHVANDVGILVIETTGESVAVATPAGWNLLAQTTDVATAAGSRLAVFWRRASSAAEASVPSFATTNHAISRIYTYRGCIPTGKPFDVVTSGRKTVASTTATLPALQTTVPETLIVMCVARPDDSAVTTHFGVPVNARLTGLAEAGEAGTAGGHGGGFTVAHGTLAIASNTEASTMTKTVSTTDVYVTFALKPYVAPTEIPTSGLFNWYKANALDDLTENAAVSRWEDSSNNGRVLIMNDVTAQPTYKTTIRNGHPAMLFDGTVDYMTGAVMTGDTFSIFAVFSAAGTDDDVVLLNGNANGYGLVATATSRNLLYRAASDNVGTAYTDNAWEVWCATRATGANGTGRLYANGTLDVTTTNAIIAPTTNLLVGRTDAGGHFKGHIAEIIMYNRVLTDTERTQVTDYLTTKYATLTQLLTLAAPSIVDIKVTTALAISSIINIGQSTPTVRGFCYMVGAGTPTTANSVVQTTGSFGTGDYNGTLTGLTSNTLYTVRAFATNAQGTAYGPPNTFTTRTAINSLNDLDAIRLNTGTVNGSTAIIGRYSLMRNLDFNQDSSYSDLTKKTTWTTGAGWNPLGRILPDPYFAADLDGQGYTISNLMVNDSVTSVTNATNAGLIGVADYCTVKNLGLINPRINANSTATNFYQTGALIMGIDPEGPVLIENCFVKGGRVVGGIGTGSADSRHNGTGGMIGIIHEYASASVDIKNCYVDGTVVYRNGTSPHAANGVGGFIGTLNTVTEATGAVIRFEDCYSTASVSSGSLTVIGGFAGVVTNPTLPNTTATDCFWDTQTSGQSSSIRGTGKTTAEMKTLSTYVNWSIASMATHTTQTWYLNPTVDYPRLYYEAKPSTNTGRIKYWNGTAFTAKPVKYWNGTAWVTKPLKRWNGTAWITTPY